MRRRNTYSYQIIIKTFLIKLCRNIGNLILFYKMKSKYSVTIKLNLIS